MRKEIGSVLRFSKGLAFAAFMGLAVMSCNQLDNNKESETSSIPVDSVAKPAPRIEWGMNIDSLKIQNGIVEKNQFLSELLQEYGVDYGVIDRMAKKSRDVFDVRKIRAGKPYAIISSVEDTLSKPLYFVYEPNKIDYVIYGLTDSLDIVCGEKPVQTRIMKSSGQIESSLWNAMVDNNTDPAMANELSEVFAWTIDFFGIQSGDFYKVIYEQKFVKDEPVGLGKIIAANFNHYGDNNFAFWFESDSTDGSYYDDKAGSLRRSFLKAPLKYKRISSRFSNSRLHPKLKIRRPHHGVDYAAPTGTPVHAVGDGTVIKAKYSGGGGNMVKIKHNGTYSTAYLHLSKYGKGIRSGKRVKQGDVIGYVGSTGLSTGPHLDFRFYRNGVALNPLKVKSPPAKPVAEASVPKYNLLKDSLKNELSLIHFAKPATDKINDTLVLSEEEPNHPVED
ncbi:MAG: peptidoglycan DD-metalloendopeptidase family protein [Bacteroidales bacterium]